MNFFDKSIWSLNRELKKYFELLLIFAFPTMAALFFFAISYNDLKEISASGEVMHIQLNQETKDKEYVILSSKQQLVIGLIAQDIRKGDFIEKQRGKAYYIINGERVSIIPALLKRCFISTAIFYILVVLKLLSILRNWLKGKKLLDIEEPDQEKLDKLKNQNKESLKIAVFSFVLLVVLVVYVVVLKQFDPYNSESRSAYIVSERFVAKEMHLQKFINRDDIIFPDYEVSFVKDGSSDNQKKYNVASSFRIKNLYYDYTCTMYKDEAGEWQTIALKINENPQPFKDAETIFK